MGKEWIPALVSLAGMAGFMLEGAAYWIGIRLGWIDGDESVGIVGCSWAVACAALILAGFMLQLGGQFAP